MRVKTKGAWGFLESQAFGSGARRALTGDECVIGSAPGSEILVNDPTVSRRHAVLRQVAGRYEVADLGSTNGTFVNGRRVSGAAALADHDVVQLGDVKVTFVRSSSGSRFNRNRLAYIALSLVAIGGIGFAATSYFVEKPSVGSEESPKPPVVAAAIASPLATVSVPAGSGVSVGGASATTTAAKPSVGAMAPAAVADFTNHDISSMAYLLCKVRIDSENYLGSPGFHDRSSEAQELYNAALRMSGPEAKAQNERAISSGGAPEGYFSYDPNPSEDENTERQRFVDWLARLKHMVETNYSAYTLVVGSSFIEPRNAQFLGAAASRSRIYPGAKYRYRGKWSETTTYLPGDLVVQPPLMIVAWKANTNVVLGSDVRGLGGGGGGQDIIGSWQLFPQDFLCSAMDTALAAKLGDPKPLGGYSAALEAIQEEEKRANDIKKLNE